MSMKICVCQYRKNDAGKVRHQSNEITIVTRITHNWPEGQLIVSSNGHKYFRANVHHPLSIHGWEVYDENIHRP